MLRLGPTREHRRACGLLLQGRQREACARRCQLVIYAAGVRNYNGKTQRFASRAELTQNDGTYMYTTDVEEHKYCIEAAGCGKRLSASIHGR